MHIDRKSVQRTLRAQTWLLCAALVGCGDGATAPNENGFGAVGAVPGSPGGTATLGGTAGATPGGATSPTGGTSSTGGTTSPTGGTSSTGGTIKPGGTSATGGTTGGTSATGGTTGGTSATGGGSADAGAVGGDDAGTGGSPDAGGTGGTGGTGEIASCLKGITNYFEAGPFKVQNKNSGSIKMWIPQVPAGCKVPMIHISNGTGATCSFYGEAIERYTSHGFLTLCYEDANTGDGLFGIQAFEKALQMYPELADKKFGSSGHSQGGQAAFVTGQFAEEKWPGGVHAILAMQPASGFGNQPKESWQKIYGKIKQPAAMYSGDPTDGLVSKGWVTDAFKALPDTTEAYHWSKSDVSHFAPNGQSLEMGVAWFRWKLLGDQDACRAFKTVPMKFKGWSVVGEQAKQECK